MSKKIQITVLIIFVLISLLSIPRIIYRYDKIDYKYDIKALVRTNIITGKSEVLRYPTMKWYDEEDFDK